MLQRGVALGTATYRHGHYTLMPRQEMSALVHRVMFEDRESPT